jgi:hypothetical protein
MPNNTKEIFYAIYCLMSLVILESSDQNVLVDVIHFCFEIQINLVTKSHDENQRKNHYCIHALIAAYFNLMSKLYGITGFSEHVNEVNRLKNFIKFYFLFFRLFIIVNFMHRIFSHLIHFVLYRKEI